MTSNATTASQTDPVNPGKLDPRLNAYRDDLADSALKGRISAAHYAPGEMKSVTTATTPVRRLPRPDAALDTEALRGEKVKIFEIDDEGWAWGQLARDRYVGYLPAADLGPADDPGTASGPTHQVCVPRTLLFPGPDIKMPPVEALPLGAVVVVSATVSGPGTDFAHIGSNNFAPAGYAPVGHLAPLSGANKQEIDAVGGSGFGHLATDYVSVAEQFIGTPYLWGGKTLLGLDCSGLVQIALHATGRKAPRDSDMQEAALGVPLDDCADLEALQRGDLVFWRDHVGIMQNAHDLLHANAHHMTVRSEKLSDMLSRASKKGLNITSLRTIV